MLRTHLQEDSAVRRQSPVQPKFMPFFSTLESPGFYILCALKTYLFPQAMSVKSAPHAAFVPNSSHLFTNEKRATLIKASKPFKGISIDFKGPLPSSSCNKYLLVITDKYSRFPFVFPCLSMYSSTVISCLEKRFSLCGMPQFMNSNLLLRFCQKV